MCNVTGFKYILLYYLNLKLKDSTYQIRAFLASFLVKKKSNVVL